MKRINLKFLVWTVSFFVLVVGSSPAHGILVEYWYLMNEGTTFEGTELTDSYTIPNPPVIGQSYVDVNEYDALTQYYEWWDYILYDPALEYVVYYVWEYYWQDWEYVAKEEYYYDEDWILFDYVETPAIESTYTMSAIAYAQPIPEPATIFVLALGGLIAFRKRRV